MRRLSYGLLAQLRSSKDLKTCKENVNGELELELFPYPRKQYDAVVVTNLQGYNRENALVLPKCGCLMPAVLRTRKKALVPDLEAWKRLYASGTTFERAEDVPKTLGTAVFFICGRGQAALDSREDCGYYVDVSFIYIHHKVTGYALHMASQDQIPKYSEDQMASLKERSGVERASRYKKLMETKPTTERQKSRSLYDALLEMGQNGGYTSPTENDPPPLQPSRRGYDTLTAGAEDEAFFLCPNCETNQPIEHIAEHTTNCRPQEPRISGASILRRRPLIGMSVAIPTGPPRYGRGSSEAGPGPTTMHTRGESIIGRTTSAAGPGPTTMANRRRPSPAEVPAAKRRRLQSPPSFTPTTLPTPILDVIELSSDDEPTIQPPRQAVRFFAERPNSPEVDPQMGKRTPPPPYSN